MLHCCAGQIQSNLGHAAEVGSGEGSHPSIVRGRRCSSASRLHPGGEGTETVPVRSLDAAAFRSADGHELPRQAASSVSDEAHGVTPAQPAAAQSLDLGMQ